MVYPVNGVSCLIALQQTSGYGHMHPVIEDLQNVCFFVLQIFAFY